MRIVFSILLMVLTGCISGLESNLSDGHIGSCDELLTGDWLFDIDGSDKIYLKANITRDCKIVEIDIYEIKDSKKESGKYKAIFTKINGLVFLNLNPIDADGIIDRTNYLVRYTWDSSDNISFYLLDDKEFIKSIRNGYINGEIKGDEKDTKYTLEINDELYTYIANNVEKLFSKRLPLARVKSESKNE